MKILGGVVKYNGGIHEILLCVPSGVNNGRNPKKNVVGEKLEPVSAIGEIAEEQGNETRQGTVEKASPLISENEEVKGHVK